MDSNTGVSLGIGDVDLADTIADRSNSNAKPTRDHSSITVDGGPRFVIS